tara:strand:+ start:333 stop:620 length:288 start_codon:yes stop_codon:yes gene_type:complete
VTNKYLKKEEISLEIKELTGFPLILAKKIVDDLVKSLNQCIKNDKLILKNIGTFKTINKKERKGRNPKTGQEHTISARKTISFTTSKSLSKLLNK